MKPYVLLRWRDVSEGYPDMPDIVVVGVYASLDDVKRRLDRMAAANKQYPLRKISDHYWRIGPEEYQGMFGDRAVNFWAIQPKEDLTETGIL